MGLFTGLSNPDKFGVNTQEDDYSRLAIKSDSVLLSHDDVTPGSGDIRLTLNKDTYVKSAEIIFQHNYSGRAVIGLSGNNDLSFSVSSDGELWQTPLSIGLDGAAQLKKINATDNISTSGDSWRANQITVAADSAAGSFQISRARGTQSSLQPVQAGDTIFTLSPKAHNGTEYKLCGGISFRAETYFNAEESKFISFATLDAGVWKEKIRVRADGSMGIGTSTPVTKLDVDGPIRPKSYIVGSLPTALGLDGAVIFVSDESGGPVPAFSDGASWLRMTDREVVS